MFGLFNSKGQPFNAAVVLLLFNQLHGHL